MLGRIILVLLVLGAAYLAYSQFAGGAPEFTGTATVNGEDDFAREIDKLSALANAESDKAHEHRRANMGIFSEEVSFSVSMSIPEFTKKMEKLGFDCKKLVGYDRLGCRKKLRRGNLMFALGLTFELTGKEISFYHGQSSLITNYL